MIEVSLPTGEVVEFEDGTPDEEIHSIIQREYFSPEADPRTLVGAVIQTESGGNPHAYNEKSQARGLMQVRPTTAENPGFGLQPMDAIDLADPQKNVQFGTTYLTKMIERYDGDIDAALMAYNWGPGNVDKLLAGEIAPEQIPSETKNYVRKVRALMGATENTAAGIEAAEDSVRPSVWGQIVEDLQRGISNMETMGMGASATIMGLGYDPEGKNALLIDDIVEDIGRIQQEAPPPVIATFREIDDLDDGFRYAVRAVMENLPTMVPSMIGGGVGGLAARRAATRKVNELVSKRLKMGDGPAEAIQNVNKAIALRTAAGGAGGAYPPAAALVTGEAAMELHDDTGAMHPDVALAAGLLGGGLDTLGIMVPIMKAFGFGVGKELTKGLVKRLGKAGAVGFLAEGSTEAAQQALINYGVERVDPSSNMFSRKNVDELIDSFLMGGIGGGVVTTVGQGVGELTRPRRPQAQAPESTPDEPTAPSNVQEEAEVEIEVPEMEPDERRDLDPNEVEPKDTENDDIPFPEQSPKGVEHTKGWEARQAEKTAKEKYNKLRDEAHDQVIKAEEEGKPYTKEEELALWEERGIFEARDEWHAAIERIDEADAEDYFDKHGKVAPWVKAAQAQAEEVGQLDVKAGTQVPVLGEVEADTKMSRLPEPTQPQREDFETDQQFQSAFQDYLQLLDDSNQYNEWWDAEYERQLGDGEPAPVAKKLDIEEGNKRVAAATRTAKHLMEREAPPVELSEPNESIDQFWARDANEPSYDGLKEGRTKPLHDRALSLLNAARAALQQSGYKEWFEPNSGNADTRTRALKSAMMGVGGRMNRLLFKRRAYERNYKGRRAVSLDQLNQEIAEVEKTLSELEVALQQHLEPKGRESREVKPDFTAEEATLLSEIKEALIEEIKALGRRVAPGATILIGDKPLTGKVGGVSYGDVIWVALEGTHDPTSTAFHEAIHWLDDNGFLTDEERALVQENLDTLIRRAKEFAKDRGASEEFLTFLEEEMRTNPHEAIAYSGGYYFSAERESLDGVPAMLRPLYRDIRKLFRNLARKVRRILKLRNYRVDDVADLFDRIESGEVAQRKEPASFTKENSRVNPTAQAAANMLNMAVDEFKRWYRGSHVVDAEGRPIPVFLASPIGDPTIQPTGPYGRGWYFYENPEAALDAGIESNERIAQASAKEQMMDPEVSQDLNTLQSIIMEPDDEWFSSEPTSFPYMVVMKDPYYAGDPLSIDDKAWIDSRLERFAKLLSSGDYQQLKAFIDTATTLEELLASGEPVLSTIATSLANARNKDGIIFDGPRGRGYLYLGDPQTGMRDVVSNFHPPKFMFTWNRDKKQPHRKEETKNKYGVPKLNDISKFWNFLLAPRDKARLFQEAAKVFLLGEALRSEASTISARVAELAKPYGTLERNRRRKVDSVLELARLQNERPMRGTDGEIVITNQLGHDTDLSKVGETIRLSGQEVDAFEGMAEAGTEMLQFLRDSWLSGLPDMFSTVEEFESIPIDPTIINAQALLQVAAAAESHMANTPELDLKAREMLKQEVEQIKRTAEKLAWFDDLIQNGTYTPFMRFGNWGVKIVDDTGEELHFETFESLPFTDKPPMAKIEARIEELLQRYPGATVQRRGSSAVFPLTHNELVREAGDPLLAMDVLISRMSDVGTESKWEELRPLVEELLADRGFQAHYKRSKNTPGYSSDFSRAWFYYSTGAAGFGARQKYGNRLREAVNEIPNSKPKLKKWASDYVDYILSPRQPWSKLRGFMFAFYIGGNLSSALIQLMNLPLYSAPQLSMFTTTADAHAKVVRGSLDAAKIMKRQMALWQADRKRLGMDMQLHIEVQNYMNPHSGIYDDVVNADELEALKLLWDEGLIKPALMIHQTGLTPGNNFASVFDTTRFDDPNGLVRQGAERARNIVEALGVSQNLLAVPFGIMESTARVAAFLAAYRVAKEGGDQVINKANDIYSNAPLWIEEKKAANMTDPYHFARYQIDDVMGRFDKTNHAPYETMGAGAGLVPFQFTGWVRQILSTLALNLFKQGKAGKKAFALSMLWLLAVSGLWGLPGFDNLKDVMEKTWENVASSKLDIDSEIRLFMKEAAGLEPWMADAFLRGAPRSVANIDISRRVGLGTLPGANIASALFGDGEVYDLFGPSGSTIFGNWQAFKQRREAGSTLAESGTEFLPTFMRNGVQSLQWMFDGYRTRNGVRLYAPYFSSDPDRVTAPEVLLKGAVGFMPARMARTQEARQAQRREQQALGPKTRFRGRMIMAATDLAQAMQDNDAKALRSARERFNKVIKDVRAYNRNRPPEDAVIIDSSAIMRQVMMNMSPELRGVLGVARQKRGVVRRLREAYGIE